MPMNFPESGVLVTIEGHMVRAHSMAVSGGQGIDIDATKLKSRHKKTKATLPTPTEIQLSQVKTPRALARLLNHQEPVPRTFTIVLPNGRHSWGEAYCKHSPAEKTIKLYPRNPLVWHDDIPREPKPEHRLTTIRL